MGYQPKALQSDQRRPLREEELKHVILKVVPFSMRQPLLPEVRAKKDWEEIKNFVRELARLMVVH